MDGVDRVGVGWRGGGGWGEGSLYLRGSPRREATATAAAAAPTTSAATKQDHCFFLCEGVEVCLCACGARVVVWVWVLMHVHDAEGARMMMCVCGLMGDWWEAGTCGPHRPRLAVRVYLVVVRACVGVGWIGWWWWWVGGVHERHERSGSARSRTSHSSDILLFPPLDPKTNHKHPHPRHHDHHHDTGTSAPTMQAQSTLSEAPAGNAAPAAAVSSSAASPSPLPLTHEVVLRVPGPLPTGGVTPGMLQLLLQSMVVSSVPVAEAGAAPSSGACRAIAPLQSKGMHPQSAGIVFTYLTAQEVRRWARKNPEYIDCCDRSGETALYDAAVHKNDVGLMEWLIDRRGADVDECVNEGETVLQTMFRRCEPPDPVMISALLERGATAGGLLDCEGKTVLMQVVCRRDVDAKYKLLDLLLGHSQVIASIDTTSESTYDFKDGNTALHFACQFDSLFPSGLEKDTPSLVCRLLKAGADPCARNDDGDGKTPLQVLNDYDNLPYGECLRLKKDAWNAARLALQEATEERYAKELVRMRRLAMAPGERVELTLEVEGEGEESDKERLRRRLVAFLVGTGAVEGSGGCPKDVFLQVVELLLPDWAPLRKGLGKGKGGGGWEERERSERKLTEFIEKERWEGRNVGRYEYLYD